MTKLLALLVALLCCAIISSCSAKEKVIGLHQNIHHDDFEYSVQSADKAAMIGNVPTHGAFFIVAFQVENHARRVNHEWKNDIAYLVDEHGAQYENAAAAQNELNRVKPFGLKAEYITPPGATGITMLVFDLPKDAKEPYLQVRGLILMGDVFDGSQYKKTRVKLF